MQLDALSSWQQEGGSKKDQAIATQSPVVGALLIVATMEDFNRSWRTIEDISCIIQSVFDLPKTKKNQLPGPVIVMNLSNDALTKESVDLRVNDIGIVFRDKFQRKISDGKKRRMKCLYLCPLKELPPTPEHGTKWYTNLQDLPLDWESKRLRMQKDDNFKIVQEDLSKLVRQLAKPVRMKKAALKQTLKRVKEDDTQDKKPSSKGPCAKKPKDTDLSSSLKDLDNEDIADSCLSKLIAHISEGDEHTKFQLTKGEIVSQMNFVTARCIAKLACLAAAEEEEVISLDDGKEDNDNNIRNEDCEKADELNKRKEMNETNEMNEANNPNEDQNEQYCYMNSSVSIANQELQLPNSHMVISRSYFSPLVESDKLSRKLKAKIIKAKQYRISHLGQRFYKQCCFDSSSTYVALCGQASLTVGCHYLSSGCWHSH
jgi:hypothetical protein